MRRTTSHRPVNPPEEKPDDWKPPGVTTEQCAVCGDEFDRHPDDPPCCSQDCWKQLRSERPDRDPRSDE